LSEIVSPAAFRGSYVTAICDGEEGSEYFCTGDSLGFITIWSLSRLFRYSFKTSHATVTNIANNAVGGVGSVDVKKSLEITVGVASTNNNPCERLTHVISQNLKQPHLENGKLINMIVCWKAHVNRIVSLINASNGILFSASLDESVR
jgi:hypothetical protein